MEIKTSPWVHQLTRRLSPPPMPTFSHNGSKFNQAKSPSSPRSTNTNMNPLASPSGPPFLNTSIPNPKYQIPSPTAVLLKPYKWYNNNFSSTQKLSSRQPDDVNSPTPVNKIIDFPSNSYIRKQNPPMSFQILPNSSQNNETFKYKVFPKRTFFQNPKTTVYEGNNFISSSPLNRPRDLKASVFSKSLRQRRDSGYQSDKSSLVSLQYI